MAAEESPVVGSMNYTDIAGKLLTGELRLLERPLRSKVWTVFCRIINQDGSELLEYVYCKCCGKVFKYNNKVSTSNLVKHKCYVSTFMNTDNEISIIEAENPTIESFENSANNLTNLLTRWVIKECKPYDLIRNEGLKAVFQEIARLGSQFGSDVDVEKFLPSLSAVAKNISEFYDKCFERVKADVASIKENGFGLTSDVWINNFTEQRYIVLTIHYLKNGVLTVRLLGLRALEGETNTNHNVAEIVKEILNDFDCELSNKSIIVTNGVDDITKAFPNAQNLPCITELLSYVLQNSVDLVPEVIEIISACFKLVNFLNKMGYNSLLGNILTGSYRNRWEIIYKVLNSVKENWSEINKILQKINESKLVLAISIHHLSAVTKTLQPFEEAIESLQDDSYATLHLVMVYLHELKKSCDTNDSEFKDFEFIERLKKNIRFNLEKTVSENITTLHKLALFLYPPTNKLLQFSDKEKMCIEEECKRQMRFFKNDLKPVVKQEIESPTTAVSKRRKLFLDFVESEASCDPNELITQELQYYKNTRVANIADLDVFNWWELQKDNFPSLYKLSRTVLATPASSAAAKRIFSTAGSLIWEKSIRDSKEMEMEKIVFINTNSELDEIDSEFKTEKCFNETCKINLKGNICSCTHTYVSSQGNR